MSSRCPETTVSSRGAVKATWRSRGARYAMPVALIACAVSLCACEREARRFRQPAAAASTPPEARVLQLEQDAKSSKRERAGPYDANAYDVAQGKRLFTW